MLLDAVGLDVRFGRTHALKSVSVTVAAGEIVTVLGANGAGKTTLLRALQGAVRPQAGRVRFDGRDITDVGSPRRVRGGLSLVPEGRQIFVGMTIEENLRIRRRSSPGRRCRRGYRAYLRALPQPGEPTRHAGPRALRRRAADAGDRACTPQPAAP